MKIYKNSINIEKNDENTLERMTDELTLNDSRPLHHGQTILTEAGIMFF